MERSSGHWRFRWKTCATDGASSGQVGQETYGAGLALVCATRHYKQIPNSNVWLFCDYPAFGFRAAKTNGKSGVRKYHLRVEGDARATCTIRFIPTTCGKMPEIALIMADGASVKGSVTVEGHKAFAVRGDTDIEIRLTKSKRRPAMADALLCCEREVLNRGAVRTIRVVEEHGPRRSG